MATHCPTCGLSHRSSRSMCPTCYPKPTLKQTRTEEDERLFATMPELLAALKHALEWIEGKRDTNAYEETAAIRAVIARAEKGNS